MRPCFFLLSVLTLLVASPASAQSLVPCTAGVQCPSRYYWESAPLTRTAPTAAPVSGTVGSGINLAGAYGVAISVCPEVGQTLTGTGTLRAVLWDFGSGSLAGWMWSPEADLSVSKTTTLANPCMTWADRAVAFRGARSLLYVADTVGVSGGTTVTIRISAQVSP